MALGAHTCHGAATSTALFPVVHGRPLTGRVLGASPAGCYLHFIGAVGAPAVVALLPQSSVRLPLAMMSAGALPAMSPDDPVVVGDGALRVGPHAWRPMRWFEPRPPGHPTPRQDALTEAARLLNGLTRSEIGLDPASAWAAVGGQPSIVEAYVAFEREISMVAARGHDGRIECFDVAENQHSDHILKISRVPAEVTPAVAAEARRIAGRIAEAFGYVGVLAVEMFVVADGAGHAVMVNEIAPRVHNSGHWTLDACSVSQFEQHIRAVAGWPLAVPLSHGRAEMINLIGDEIADYRKWLDVPGACVHLYGKQAVRAGRKMGHVTRVFR